MLFESGQTRVTTEHGIATLWLAFPGEPANALDLTRLRLLDRAIQAVAEVRSVQVLVIRSANAAGFCAGLRPDALALFDHPTDRAALAWFGQQVFERIARLGAVTLAFIDGPCLGVGLELALACDHRVCVARPTTLLGFPNRMACFGGSARLRHLLGRSAARELLASGRTLSGREALALGLVDLACCERRGKIELRTFLDQLESYPVKPREPADLSGLAAERRAFATTPTQVSEPLRFPPPINPLPIFPEVIGLLGDDPQTAAVVGKIVLQGGSAVVCGNPLALFQQIDQALTRGFITPLEAEQARQRVQVNRTPTGFERAGLVFVAENADPAALSQQLRPRTVVCVARTGHTGVPSPRRIIRVAFTEKDRMALFPGPYTHPDTTATVAAWFKPFGFSAVVFPAAARLLPRAA